MKSGLRISTQGQGCGTPIAERNKSRKDPTGSLAVGIVLVVLIPFLRKLITDKAKTPPAETPGPACRAVA